MVQNLILLTLKILSFDSHDGNFQRESFISLTCSAFEMGKRLSLYFGQEMKSMSVSRKSGNSDYSRTLEVIVASAKLVSKEFSVEEFKSGFKEAQKKIEACF